MTYPILRARIRALEEQLTVVERSPEWLDTMGLRSAGDKARAGMRDGLTLTIGLAAGNQKDRLKEIVKELEGAEQLDDDARPAAIRDAWGSYFEVQKQSEEIFGECLRFLGGLAIRSKGFDQMFDTQIWEVADELVRGCASSSTGNEWRSLTVPAPREAVAKTLARMIRLRFPAWNVWTIPLAAREYGHVVAEEANDLPAYIETQVRAIVGAQLDEIVESELAAQKGRRNKAKLRQDLTATGRNTLARAETATPDELHIRVRTRVEAAVDREQARFHILVADAYATYTLGVAYACAALLLRFEPSTGPRDVVISDAERGEVVLAMLERMNEESDDRPYTVVLERLRSGWSALLDQATTSGSQLDHAAPGKAFVDGIWRAFRSNLRSARYPDDDASEGWLSVKAAKVEWEKTFQDTGEFGTSELELRKLRDVLNAAWSWRLDHPTADERTIRALEKATMEVCSSIIGTRRKKPDGGSGSAQRPTRRRALAQGDQGT